MENQSILTKCYIAGFENQEIDPDLHRRGFCHGMLAFAIPHLGILFRCRARGEAIDLEFGALFSLLKFIKTKLAKEDLKNLQIFSSSPEFVFSFAGNSKHLPPDSQRMKMVKKYHSELKMQIGLIEMVENKALIITSDFPSMPDGCSISFEKEKLISKTPRFKPFQQGIRL